MTATYTFDVFTSLDGLRRPERQMGRYWGKQGPELLDHRLALYDQKQRMVFLTNTYRGHAQMLATCRPVPRPPWSRGLLITSRFVGSFDEFAVHEPRARADRATRWSVPPNAKLATVVVPYVYKLLFAEASTCHRRHVSLAATRGAA
ncbi:hypothetical protein QFZ30_000551 [Arthrobacter pascens]|nr:hypothetical protein [Arthrobacter pascens]